MSESLEIKLTVDAGNHSSKASLLLAEQSGLSQATIKKAMQKGAVWLQRGNSAKRLRRASKPLQPGDVLVLNYDPAILNQTVPTPHLIHDAGAYSVWFKPFAMACQGSRWGDFGSLSRWVELNLPDLTQREHRPVYLVHRLDRATTGLILLAHSKTAARKFSELFAQGDIDKRYQAIVQGDFSSVPPKHLVDQTIDGKNAQSVFTCVASRGGRSLLDVELLTGRKHQIRKHLVGMGFPIVGDRLYHPEYDHTENLQLQSVSLGFQCPFTGKPKFYEVSPKLRLDWHHELKQ